MLWLRMHFIAVICALSVLLVVRVTPPGKCFAQCHFLVGLSMGSYQCQMTQSGCFVSFGSFSPLLPWLFPVCSLSSVVLVSGAAVCA